MFDDIPLLTLAISFLQYLTSMHANLRKISPMILHCACQKGWKGKRLESSRSEGLETPLNHGDLSAPFVLCQIPLHCVKCQKFPVKSPSYKFQAFPHPFKFIFRQVFHLQHGRTKISSIPLSFRSQAHGMFSAMAVIGLKTHAIIFYY